MVQGQLPEFLAFSIIEVPWILAVFQKLKWVGLDVCDTKYCGFLPRVKMEAGVEYVR